MAKRKYRGLFSADQHMSNKLPYAAPSERGHTDRLDHQIAIWKQMMEYAAEFPIDGVYLLGDLFDKAYLDPVTLVETVKAICNLACVTKVYILPGNHDASSVRGERFNVEMFAELGDRVTYLRSTESLKFPAVRFWPIEYMTQDATRTALARIRTKLGPKSRNVLLFHNAVVGCQHLSWLCDDGLEADGLLEGFDEAIGGHFHTHQTFGSSGKGMYCGSWMQHDFGDIDERRGFWDITWTEGKRGREDKFVESCAPKFWRADAPGIPDNCQAGDYLRWEVKGTYAEYESVRGELEKAKQALKGIHVSYLHKLVHQHKERIVVRDGDTEHPGISMREMIHRYPDAEGVEVGTLESARLKALGAEIWEEAGKRA